MSTENQKETMTTAYDLVPMSTYTSGNVRYKLTKAEIAAASNPLFLPNVELLKAVQPKDIPLTDVSISFSSIWIPLRHFENFIYDVLNVRTTVRYSDATSAWSIEIHGSTHSTANTSTYGLEWEGYTSMGNLKIYKLTATDLIEQAMNFKTPSVRRKSSDCGSFATDADLTAGAIDKQQRLQDAFADWLRADPDRKRELEERYNKQFNALRLPTYDGSHLKFPGMSEFWRERMRDYQANCIYRGTLGNYGAFLEVGLGKTLVGQSICMERKRIDPRTKSVIIVKKATLKDFTKDFREAYPHAKLLIATERDCNEGNRQLFMAKVATGNYDCIVMTHEGFLSLPLRPETIERHIQPMLERIKSALEEFGVFEGAAPKKNKPYSVKNLEKSRNRLKAKLQQATEKLQKRGQKGLYFEDLGINYICADEADVYINAPIETKLMGIAGLSSDPSSIAIDFEWKIEWLRQTHGTGRLCLMTGTFISNTMANLYVMQRFLQPEMLEERGIMCFDAWASMFGQVRTGAEVKADGTIGRKSRFSKFVNMPELLQLFFMVAEIVRFDDVKSPEMVRPTAEYINILAPMSPDQEDIMAELVERAEDIRARDPQTFMGWNNKTKEYEEKFDNLLRVTTHGRWASLDARMLRPNVPDFERSKVNMCVDNVFNIWQETAENKSIQMIFLDMSTPGNGKDFSVYEDIKAKLIAKGVPEDEIAFMQDYKTDEGKEFLLAQARVGIKRILLGSRSTMGVGVNVQHKLYALHHLDCPWRPRDLEQAEGRGIRSGNENSVVRIYRYITQGSNGNCGFDSFMWQLIEAKWRFILQIMRGDMSIRTMEEDASDNPTFSAAEVKALATGNMSIMRYTDVQAQLETLLRLENSIIMDIDNLNHGNTNSIPWSQACIRKSTKILKDQAIDFDLVKKNLMGCTGDNFKIHVNKEDYTDRKAAGETLVGLAHYLLDQQDQRNKWSCVGRYGGFEILMMSPTEVRVVVLLCGLSGETYEVRFVRDRGMACDRIESAYLKILDVETEAVGSIERNEQAIIQIRDELIRKQKQLGDVRSQVQEFALEKSQLEAELGLGEGDADASMLALCGEDED